jgi:hypothetical protein
VSLILCIIHACRFGKPCSPALALCFFCLVLSEPYSFTVHGVSHLRRLSHRSSCASCSFYFDLPVTSRTYPGCFPFFCRSLSGSSTVISDASLLCVQLVSFPRSLPVLLHDCHVHVSFVQVLLLSPSEPQPSRVLQVSCSFMASLLFF